MEKTYLSLDEDDKEHSAGLFVQLKNKRIERLKKQNQSAWAYMGVAGEIGFSIALPIAGGAIGGSFLDSRWGTYPKMTLSLLFAGIVLSIINFVFIIKTILDKEK